MALELYGRDASDGGPGGDSDDRALDALRRLLEPIAPAASAPPAHREDDDVVVDVRDGALDVVEGDSDWVGVADAAERAGVSTGTVRQWYRAGLLATQRRDGDRGSYLVPVGDVIRLAAAAAAGDADTEGASVIDINASYWSAETDAARADADAARADADAARADADAARAIADDARAEARRAAADLDAATAQIATARDQLREARGAAAAAERTADALRSELEAVRDELRAAHAGVAALEREVATARRAATFGSVTTTDWVAEAEQGYRGALRPQDPLGQMSVDDTVGPEAGAGLVEAEEDDPLSLLTLGMPPIVYGEAADDLLPESEERARRRRR